jgi:hypothetical protein
MVKKLDQRPGPPLPRRPRPGSLISCIVSSLVPSGPAGAGPFFDLFQLNGGDLRALPLIDRKARLAKLLKKKDRPGLELVEPLQGGQWSLNTLATLCLNGSFQSARTFLPFRSIERLAQDQEPQPWIKEMHERER